MNSEEIFGQVLKSIRKEKKLNQEELAFRSNLDWTYISMLERGIHQPTLNSLLAIAAALDMKAAKLVQFVEEQLNKQNLYNIF
ncbi:transcriptional regulator [Paenibacillus odorifer]|uniref:helix-turn-helix domain-containing protein n=1 Tax=Paenibacillus TaxID=44249 RepID=UPI00096E613A|nr:MULTISPECIES: helix-turn-helix transcriptional regulator [Paenibacillus]MDH6428065.1 transcriptional regulator with XRE-family HTH domain [Paenibacillus sp. PastH-4]MDH6444305.1 transcriptional regulator with XRE-family HTH domain [Paenibacillus sp. PastF-4]MDH6528206.1 transcriptional regulator with XRE-family HTH domain [Paenibacillus sp. PastH-3]OMD67833.1 transcriptional regulator [Paenibacillus odorifer]